MIGLKTLLFGRENRIARRLIVLTIAFSSAITLIISAVQLVFEYRELRSSMERSLNGVAILVPSLSGSVWNFDEGQIRLTLDAIKQVPNIDQVSVLTPDKEGRWTNGTDLSAHVVTRAFSLRQRVRGTDAEIGRLEVVASLDAIYRQVAASALSIVLSNGLKTFLVALFMVILLRRLVTSRLEHLARRVGSMNPKRAPAEGAQPWSPAVPAGLDELDAVDWALDNTAAGLRRAEERLRASLAEKETLLREIHHRVKNNLQIISSLLHFQSQKSRTAEDSVVFEEGRNRLKSMILVHEKLYRSQSLSRIEFGDYVRELVEQVGGAYRERAKAMALKVEAETVYLPIEVALPLGMLLSELVTNVHKYAYPTGQAGELRVRITGAEGRLELTVADDGAGLPEGVDPSAPGTFGMQLVANLAGQLAGEVRYVRGTGLRVEVSVPLAAKARDGKEQAA
jgi:two-component sensor histidine kinase